MDYTMFPMAMTMSSAPTTCYIKQEPSASYQEDTILDLCVRKRVRTESPDYTLSYPSPKSTPEYEDLMSPVSSPKTTDTTSECSEPNSRTSSTSPEPTCRTRPFKAFPKEPFSLHLVPQIPTLPDPDYRDYEEFRKKMLAQVQSCHNSSNKNMRRNQVQSSKNNDPEYLERRKKNNEAAKRSRDARKAKEDEIAIRCAYLEQQNISLKYKLAALNNELEKLRCMMYR